jgi:hypothetical protein
MDLPGAGLINGPWDMRAGVEDYLGHVAFRGKRALDIGTASGFLCFEMERRGADVVAYDLSNETVSWDLVPFGGAPDAVLAAERTAGLGLINNSYWFAHAALESHAKVVYGSVYELPTSIGEVQIANFGAILLHLRDPFLALQRALVLTTETVIITEPAGPAARVLARFPRRAIRRLTTNLPLRANLGFLPNSKDALPYETWWRLTPWAVARLVSVLGFEVLSVTFHSQIFQGEPCLMYTLVGRRPQAASRDRT